MVSTFKSIVVNIFGEAPAAAHSLIKINRYLSKSNNIKTQCLYFLNIRNLKLFFSYAANAVLLNPEHFKKC